MEEKRDRKIYFDFLRIFATFAVILLHVAAHNWHSTDINSIEWKAFNFYDSIARWGVPIFVMISGALFLNRDLTIKTIYKKYILRIVIAFAFWSILYAVLFTEPWALKNIILSIVKGDVHMWFLFMIVGLYMITPFLKQIITNETLIKYFIILGIVFAIIMPQLISLISIKSIGLGEFIQTVMNNSHLNFVMGFSVYYMLGYYLDKKDIKSKEFKYICLLGILGFAITIIGTIVVSRYTNQPNILFYKNFTINVFFEAVFVFVIAKKYLNKIKLNNKIQNMMSHLSKYSFGIYLVHLLVLRYLDTIFNINSLSFNPIISIPIVSIIIFGISLLISFVINQIPILKKYIV